MALRMGGRELHREDLTIPDADAVAVGGADAVVVGAIGKVFFTDHLVEGIVVQR
jgi:hypothetical protein